MNDGIDEMMDLVQNCDSPDWREDKNTRKANFTVGFSSTIVSQFESGHKRITNRKYFT